MSGIKDKPIYKVIWSVLSVIIAACAIYAVMSQAKDFSFTKLFELIKSGTLPEPAIFGVLALLGLFFARKQR